MASHSYDDCGLLAVNFSLAAARRTPITCRERFVRDLDLLGTDVLIRPVASMALGFRLLFLLSFVSTVCLRGAVVGAGRFLLLLFGKDVLELLGL